MSCGKAVARIRRMTSADLDRVIGIAARLEHAPQWPRAAYEAVFEPAKPQRIAQVAERPDGDLAGFAIALVMPPEAEIETIGVVHEFQRRGVARQIFEGIAAAASTFGVTEMTLEVRASNAAALAFYRTMGFTEDGRRLRYYADPIEDAVLMRLSMP